MERDEFVAATKSARRQLSRTAPATAARYDRRVGRVVVQLGSGVALMFDPRHAQGLEDATSAQLSQIEITPSGLGLHFPKLDADVYIPGLLEGALGSKRWMASRLGVSGGKKTSAEKKRASRANGRLGGRPRKVAG